MHHASPEKPKGPTFGADADYGRDATPAHADLYTYDRLV
jgi:hypothetical protein